MPTNLCQRLDGVCVCEPQVIKPPEPLTFEQARELARKAMAESPMMDYGLKKLKDNNKITKYNR